MSGPVRHHLVSTASYPAACLHDCIDCCHAGGLRVPWALTTQRSSLCRCFSSSLHLHSQLCKGIETAVTMLKVCQISTQAKSSPAAKPRRQILKLMYKLMQMQVHKVCPSLTTTAQDYKQRQLTACILRARGSGSLLSCMGVRPKHPTLCFVCMIVNCWTATR